MLNTTLLAISQANPLDLGPLIYGFALVIAVFGALVGFWRGFMRQTVRIITILIAIIISYALIPFIYGQINEYIDSKSMAELQTMLTSIDKLPGWLKFDWILSLDGHTAKLFALVPISLLVMPVIFVICFIVINKLLLILHKLISALCGFKSRRNTLATRLLGFMLGFLQGAIIAGIILMPIIGVGSMAKESIESVREYSPDEASTEDWDEVYTAYLRSVSENPLTSAYGILGMNALYERIATVNLDGTELNMTEICPDAFLLASDVTKLHGCDPKDLTPEEEQRILTMLERAESNRVICDIIASAVRSGSYAYKNGSFPATPPEPFNTLIIESLEIFHTSTAENLSGDLHTMADIYFTLSKSGVLTSFNDGSDAIVGAMNTPDSEGKTAANKIIEIAKSNERTTPLLTALTKLSVTAMQNGSGIDESALEAFENIKAGINSDVLTIDKNNYESKEDYVADLSAALDNTLKGNSIELEKEIVDEMANYVADNFSETQVLTDVEACEIIFSYYDAYLKYRETGEMPEI